jgi:site-specific DNA-methyltransferase (adenine-specific)
MRVEKNSIDSALFLSVPMDWGNVVGAMKPGAHLLLFSDVKKHHVRTIAAEDNGLEIRDTIAWVYDSGKQIPDMLLVTVARRPLEGTVAENTLKYGTGGFNIDGCRVELNGDYKCKANGRPSQTGLGDNYDPSKANQADVVGRWPANLTHDNSLSVVAMFPDAKSGCGNGNAETGVPGNVTPLRRGNLITRKDGGSAARFFYTAPCLNDLLKYLLKLITPPGGTVLTNCDNILVQSAYPSVKYDED